VPRSLENLAAALMSCRQEAIFVVHIKAAPCTHEAVTSCIYVYLYVCRGLVIFAKYLSICTTYDQFTSVSQQYEWHNNFLALQL